MTTLRFRDGFYQPPEGDEIVLRFGGVEIPSAPGRPDFIKTLLAVWGEGRQRLRPLFGGWAGGRGNNKSRSVSLEFGGLKFRAALHIEAALDLKFGASSYVTSFGGLELAANSYSLAWVGPNLRFSSSGFQYGGTQLIANNIETSWHGPNLRFGSHDTKFGFGFTVFTNWFLAWRVPAIVRHNGFPIRWGYRFTPPYCEHAWIPEIDAPGGALVLRFVLGDHTPPPGDQVELILDITKAPIHCYERDESGPKTGAPPPIPPGVSIVRRPYDLEVYYMPTAITLKRVSDNAPIQVLRASVSIDLDSFTWSFSADLQSAADYDLVQPSGGNLQTVELGINGHIWRFVVERRRRGKRFNSRTYSISGRSIAAELAAPYAAATTYTQSAAANAQALAIASLPFDWSVSWSLVDWALPVGSLTYTDKTPIEVVTMLAAAAGGVVQAHPSSKTLLVFSRYPVSPWDWATTTPDIAINDLVVKALDSDDQPGPPYNRVFVSGEHAGNVLQLTRDGTAGDSVAPVVVDRLLTHITANRERGRVELSRSGRHSEESIDLPLATPPDEPALIVPGTLIEVTDGGETWRGLVLSVSIDAVRESAAVVNQRITVERFYP